MALRVYTHHVTRRTFASLCKNIILDQMIHFDQKVKKQQ